MKLKTFVFLIIFGAFGYWAYGYITTQFSQEAMAYKRYAEALLDGDGSKVQNLVTGDLGKKPFMANRIRQDRIGGDVRFTYYEFLSHQYSEDRKTVTMRVRQSIRVDPPGQDSFFGKEVRRELHTVTLVRDQSAWKVEQFQDAATSEYSSEK